MKHLAWTMIALVSSLFATSGAVAQSDFCAPLKAGTAQKQIQLQTVDRADINLIQAGLRSVNGRLAGINGDGAVGQVMQRRLAAMCDQVPLGPAADPVRDTVDLARDYGRIIGLAADGPLQLGDTSLLANAGIDTFDRRVVRLGGSARMAVAALSNDPVGNQAQCDALGVHSAMPADTDLESLKRIVAAIAGADPIVTISPAIKGETQFGPALQAAAKAICTLYPSGTAPSDFFAAMVEYGAILKAHPDAIDIMGSGDFGFWLTADRVNRTFRLLGTPPAVIALLSEYEDGEQPRVPDTAGDGTSPSFTDYACPDVPVDSALTYFALSSADIAGLRARVDVRATLEPLMEQRLDTLSQLTSEIAKVLSVEPGSCAAYKLGRIVVARPEETKVFRLDDQRVQDLALAAEFSQLLPAVEALKGSEDGDQTEFLASVQDVVAAEAKKAVEAAIEEAVAVTAKAAIDESPPPDFPAPGLPEDVLDEPRPEQLVINDESMKLIEAQVENPEIVEAIGTLPEEPVATREEIERMAFELLVPMTGALAKSVADAALAKIDTAAVVDIKYRLTDTIIQALESQPEFTGTDLPPEFLFRSLSDLQYPFGTLMEAAVASPEPDQLGLAGPRALLSVAQKTVISGRREVGPLGKDCGCTVPRKDDDNALVYAFWPFWLADLRPTQSGAAEPAQAEGDLPVEPGGGVAQIDFELVNRVAFDGLIIGENRRIMNLERWEEAAPNFLLSAHKHKTKVDLSFRLRDWWTWEKGDSVEEIAGEILKTLKKKDFPAEHEAGWWLESRLDRLLSRSPDGVTLILDFENSTNAPTNRPMARIVELVGYLDARTKDIEGFQINLALNPLDAEFRGQTVASLFDGGGVVTVDPIESRIGAAARLFRDLESILPGAEAAGNEPLVDTVLVFLPRTTSEAKKQLRAMLEGIYQGEHRVKLLRRVIPVMPDGAHKWVFRTRSMSEFSQLEDDVIYFQDNFGGIGLWPAPRSDKNGEVRGRILKFLDLHLIKVNAGKVTPSDTAIKYVRDRMEPVCTYTCPKRLVGYFLMVVVSLLIVATTWLALYNGYVNRMANKYWVVPILGVFLLALLAMAQICDAPKGDWAQWTFMAVVGLVMIILAVQQYYRRVDGRIP